MKNKNHHETELSPGVVIVRTTWPASTSTQALSKDLLTNRLAACVQVSAPLVSHYVYRGQREESREVIVDCKTYGGRQQVLIERILELHPYETPEVLVQENLSALATYANWVKEMTSD